MDEFTAEARLWGRDRAYWLKYCDILNEKEGWDDTKRGAWLVAELKAVAELGVARGMTRDSLLRIVREAAPDVYERIVAVCPGDSIAEGDDATLSPWLLGSASNVPGMDARTMVELPSRTLLTEHRVGSLNATNMLAAASIRESVRLAVDSEGECNAGDARAKRVAAALAATQAIEDVLQTRFRDAMSHAPPDGLRRLRDPSLASMKDAILALVGKDVPKAKRYGADRLLQAARDGRAPSLAVIGGWFRSSWRVEPAALASALQFVTGIPPGLEEDTFEAGEVRNALAHRMNKERDPLESLGGAIGHVVRVDCEGMTRLDVPDRQLAWLHWLAVSILKRKEQARVNQDPQAVEEQIHALPRSG